MFRFALIALLSLLPFAATGQTASTSVGIFEGHNDVGNVLHPGTAEYHPDTGSYMVSGSGENMWLASDDFHFVWKKISAQDVILTANISILGSGGEGHRRGPGRLSSPAP